MVYAQHRIRSGEWDVQSFLVFWDTKDHLILSRQTDPMILKKKKKKRTCQTVDFAVSVELKVKL